MDEVRQPRQSGTARLDHAQIQQLMLKLGESGVLNLDTSVRALMGPVAEALRPLPGSEVSLHIVCCNEYGLVTS